MITLSCVPETNKIEKSKLFWKVNIIWTATSYEETFCDSENILYLNCGGSYLGVFLSTHSIVHLN